MPHLVDHHPNIVPERSRRCGDVFADGPAGRLELPIACVALERPPSREMLDTAAQSNAGVLAFLLQEIEIEARPRPLDEPLAEALAPIRVKLDMIIDMLARLSYREVELPLRRQVELAPGRIAWLMPRRQRPGDWLRIEIYFHSAFRDPVVLFGKVAVCDAGDEGDYCTHCDLVGISEHVGGDLARLAYLAHRRQRAPRAAERRGK